MIRPVAAFLLLLQLHSFGCAVCCLQDTAADGSVAEMAMGQSGTGGSHDASPSQTAPMPQPDEGCPIAQLCAVPVGALTVIRAELRVTTAEVIATVPSYTNAFHPTESAAPLVPPPNA